MSSIAALKAAAKRPKVTENTKDPAKLYLKVLNKIVAVIRQAQAQDLATSNPAEWELLLEGADKIISKLCHEQYEEEICEEVGPFGLPVEPSDYVKTKTWGLGVGQNSMLELLNIFMGFKGADREEMKAKFNQEFVAPKWSTTMRPSPNSTLLSRFTPEYAERADIHLGELVTTSESLRAVLHACAELRDYRTNRPWNMVIGGDTVVVASAGGWKEREPTPSLYTLPDASTKPDDPLSKKSDRDFRMGFDGPFGSLYIDSSGIWTAGDGRIKAFNAETGKLMHTLNSKGYSGMFGINDRIIFRANSKGTFGLWQKAELQHHDPVWRWSKEEPFGGEYSGGDDSWMDEDAELEISAGQKPSSTFKVPKVTAGMEDICAVPNSTKFIFVSSPEEGSGGNAPKNFGIREFDLEKPEAGARVAGLGMGSHVSKLCSHKAIPDFFVAAGNDPLARIYDYRNPLPQMVLDGHIKSVTSCAIAPLGGQCPVIFTGSHDELVKAWDIRHSKACLYELSAGTLQVEALAWHDERNTLFIAGDNSYLDRMGGHHDYEELEGDSDEDFEDQDEGMEGPEGSGQQNRGGATYWPTKANTDKDYFGARWCSTNHALLEYRFKLDAAKDAIPGFDEPHLGGFLGRGW